MDTLIYIIYGILVLCAIVVFIRLGKPGSFIPHPYEDDEMFDSRTVAQMRGDWEIDTSEGKGTRYTKRDIK